MLLRTYLENRNLTYGQFAKAIGVSRNAVYYWSIGKRRPSIPNTLKIEEYTERLVTARDLFTTASEESYAQSEQGTGV
jgi:transcriptional regulator with XRE-family HTH domain